jgi:hypothetical protein
MEKIFYWSYGGLIWGEKWNHTNIDHFTKKGRNFEYFSSEKGSS